MVKLDGLVAFVAVADAGSVSEAARRLHLSKSVVSERLAELERSLGSKLIQRTTRSMTLTEDGAAFLKRARRIVVETLDAAAEITERRGELTGPLRISAPVSFGVLHLAPAINSFLAAHPRIELSLELDDRFVDVAGGGYDMVIRHGVIRDSWLVAQPLASSRRRLVASPDYLAARGAPASPAELEACDGILYTNRDTDWRLVGPDGAVVVRPRASLRVNNGLMMRSAALAGLGVALLPTFMIHEELASGALRAFDVGIEPEGAEIHIVYPRDRGPSAKVRVLISTLRALFGDPPYWERPA
ncbi:MAG: LysR family transcriptional regulator [Phenylobacterium sp.]